MQWWMNTWFLWCWPITCALTWIIGYGYLSWGDDADADDYAVVTFTGILGGGALSAIG